MLRSNLSSWFGLTNAMLIICILAHNVEMQMTNLHMGILETRQDLRIEAEQVQSTDSLQDKDNEYYKRLQCSYALTALRHLQLTEEFLYSSNNEFQYIPTYDFILFDAEAVSMLATVHSVPMRHHLKDILLTLWFYTVRVHRLLGAPSKGKVDSLKTQFMFKAHQSIKESLRSFVKTNMGKFKDVQNKFDDISTEKISGENDRISFMFTNKGWLNYQMLFNENHRISTYGKKHISFETLSNYHMLDKIGIIVVDYFGQKYWTIVKTKFSEIYATAMNLDVTISYQITYLWHIKNGIMKILKLILMIFIEKYLVFSVNLKDTNELIRLDKDMTSKLSEYCECVGRMPDFDTFVLRFRDRFSFEDFYEGVKGDIIREKNYYPFCTDIENISDYYLLLNNVSNMKISKETEEWQNIKAFIEKVKTLFSNVDMSIKTFDIFPILSESFKSLKEFEHQ